MNNRTLSLPIAAAFVGALGLTAIVPMAQAQTPSTAPVATAAPRTSREAAKAAKQAAHDAQRNDFAQRLGITREKLEQAHKDLAKADIDAAVAAGRITTAQGATLKTAIDQRLDGVGRGRKHGIGLGRRGGLARNADGTAPTAAQIQAARDAREARFAQLLGVTVEKLRQAATDIEKAQVDAAVAAGRLTPAQAATIKTGIDQGLRIGHFGGHGGVGHGGGGHGGGGRHGLGGRGRR